MIDTYIAAVIASLMAIQGFAVGCLLMDWKHRRKR